MPFEHFKDFFSLKCYLSFSVYVKEMRIMLKDLTGQRFGKLIVLKQDLEKKSKYKYWIC